MTLLSRPSSSNRVDVPRSPRPARHLIWAAVTGLLSLAVAVIALGIRTEMLAMRWQSGAADDQMLHYMVATAAGDSPFFAPNERMGFPLAQNLFFAPQYDPLTAVMLTLVGLFIEDGVLVLNLYQVAAFFIVGAVSYLFFACLRLRVATSVVFALIFSLAPFHFQRMEFGHAFVANYWAVPLVGILLLMVAGPATNPFESWVLRATTRTATLVRRIVPIVALTLLVSLSLSYYFVFGVILMGGVLIAVVVQGLVTGDGIRASAWPALTVGALVVFVGVQLLVLSLDFGDRYENYFANRNALQSEFHAGRLATLLLPWEGSRLPILSELGLRYNANTSVSIFAEPPGTPFIAAGAIALIIAFVVIRLIPGVSAPPTTTPASVLEDPRAGLMAATTLWGLLFYMVAGLGVVFAFLVGAELRAWVRMSIFLILLALGFLAVLLDTVVRRAPLRAAVLVVICAVAFVDQIAGVRQATDLQPTDDAAYRAFVADAEELLPSDCGVVQLPLKGFPETGPIGAMPDYAEALPYVIASDNSLRWSYGAVRGSISGDYWADATTPEAFASAVRSSGACAIQIDRLAYVDDPAGWQAFVSAVTEDDAPALQSSDRDNRFALFVVMP